MRPRASGASPRHSGHFYSARVVQREPRPYKPVALDRCRVSGALPDARTIVSPCGVVQPTRLPLKQEITGAKPVRDANFSARGSRGIADPPGLEPGSLGRASRLAPTNFSAPKAFSAMRLLGRQGNSVQLRVGAPFYLPPSTRWPSSGAAVEPALRQVS